jgi:hypothetical protein
MADDVGEGMRDARSDLESISALSVCAARKGGGGGLCNDKILAFEVEAPKRLSLSSEAAELESSTTTISSPLFLSLVIRHRIIHVQVSRAASQSAQKTRTIKRRLNVTCSLDATGSSEEEIVSDTTETGSVFKTDDGDKDDDGRLI